MKNKGVVFNIIVVSIFVAILSLCNIFQTSRPEISEVENRDLAKMPDFSFNKLFSGKYFAEFDTFFADTFFKRDILMTVSAYTDIFKDRLVYEICSRTGENNPILCYLKIGTENSASIVMHDDKVFFVSKPSMDGVDAYANAVNKFTSAFPLVKTSVIVAPTQSEMIPSISRIHGYNSEEYYLTALKEKVKCNFVDLTRELKDKKDLYSYFRTDHHWTAMGAYIGYKNFMLSKSESYTELTEKDFTNHSEFVGSFLNFSKKKIVNTLHDNLFYYTPKYNSSVVIKGDGAEVKMQGVNDLSKENYGVFLSGDHGFVNINVDSDSTKNILVIKDSYANALLPFLVDDYKEITVIDPRLFKDSIFDLVKEKNISEVLFINNFETLAAFDFIEKMSKLSDK